jgi:hypothetical protein
MCIAVQKQIFLSRLVSAFTKKFINLPKMYQLNLNKELMQIEIQLE